MRQISPEPHVISASPVPPRAELEDPVVRIAVPAVRRLTLRDLFAHGEVVRVLAARDFKVKYKQSALGPLWVVFQPFALLAGFLVAFRGLGNVQTGGVPYVVFALVGLSAWTFFTASMTIGSASILSSQTLVRYTPCPRTAFPIAAILASLPSFAITALAAVIGALVTGVLSPRLVLLPVGLAWLGVLTLGLAGATAALAVRFRDMTNALPFLLQVGAFFAPIGYPLARLSPAARAIVDLNPLTGLIEAWRWMMLSGYRPHLPAVFVSLALTPLVLLLGWAIFSKAETTMADVI